MTGPVDRDVGCVDGQVLRVSAGPDAVVLSGHDGDFHATLSYDAWDLMVSHVEAARPVGASSSQSHSPGAGVAADAAVMVELLEIGLLKSGDWLEAVDGSAGASVDSSGALTVDGRRFMSPVSAAAAAGADPANGWDFWLMPGSSRPLSQMKSDLAELAEARARYEADLERNPEHHVAPAEAVDVSQYEQIAADVAVSAPPGKIFDLSAGKSPQGD